MARTTTNSCDICKKPCERIVAKMFYSPVIRGGTKPDHTNYTHRLDVGECCAMNASGKKILKLFNWRRRMSMKEFQEARRNGNA